MATVTQVHAAQRGLRRLRSRRARRPRCHIVRRSPPMSKKSFLVALGRAVARSPVVFGPGASA